MVDPNKWTEFYANWRKRSVPSALALFTVAVLVLFTAECMGISVASRPIAYVTGRDADDVVIVSSPTPRVSDRPLQGGGATPAQQETGAIECEVTYPTNGQKVGGQFRIEGSCPSLAGATVFLVLRDVFPYPNLSDVPQQAWVQCQTTVRDTGDFLCSAFACIDAEQYEILVIYPRTAAAMREYATWYRDRSNEGMRVLPRTDDIGLVGHNLVVVADHAIVPTPHACSSQDPELP